MHTRFDAAVIPVFRVSLLRLLACVAVVMMLTIAGCTRLPGVGETPLKPRDYSELEGYLVQHPTDVDQFRALGPFTFTVNKDLDIAYAPRTSVKADLYVSGHPDKAPLLVIAHGHDATKEAHSLQAMHLASWGVHTLVLQLPKTGPWPENGRKLAAIVRAVKAAPRRFDPKVDVQRIILAGHSFGGVAVSFALSEGLPVMGAVLLDPATMERGMPGVLAKITQPVMVLGADRSVSQTRNRDTFYRNIRRGVAEISMKEASHEDGQYPSQWSLEGHGGDSYTTEEGQITFVSALTASVLSLSSTGGFDQAWASFQVGVNNGRFADPRRK